MTLKITVSTLAICTMLCSVAARAQTADQQATPQTSNTNAPTSEELDIGDIIVTAQKRSESINSVPLAISAIGAADIASRGVTDATQLAKVIPSFNVLKSAYGQPIFYIRGIGFADVTVSISPAVSVYTDEAPLPYTTMARGASFDLERIEVLKGPQGTLFGQNSTGGAVNFIAAKPTSELAAGIDLEAGRFGMINAGAFISGPLSDTLRGRIAVQNRYQDDWQRSISRGEKRGEQRFLNGRATLDWNPREDLRFELTGAAWKDESDNLAPQFLQFAPARTGSNANQTVTAAMAAQVRAPDDNRVGDWDPGSRTAKDDRFYQMTLRGEYDAGWSTFTSISTYADAKIDSPVDVDGTTFANAFFVQIARLKTFSQELRLASNEGAGVKWLVGANYQHANTRELLRQTINATNNVVGPFTYNSVHTSSNQRVNTYAGFASLEVPLTPTLSARASGRYTWERRRFDGCLADPGDGVFANAFSLVGTGLSGQPVTIAPGACATFDDETRLPLPTVRKSLDENNFSWRAGIDWKPDAGTLLYANIAKGYKSGGFTAIPAIFAEQLTPVTQESVLAYEAGLKATLFDRRVQFNLAGFYYDYKNKQLQGYVNVAPFGPLPRLVNIPTSRVYGAEAELTVRPVEGLRVQLSGAILDTKATSSPTVAVGPLGGTYDFAGESFPNTPKYQMTGDIEQRFPLGSNVEGYVGGSMQLRSSASGVFGRTQNALTRSIFTIDGYALFDLRAGLSLNDGQTTIEAWGRNITNKFYVVGVTRIVDTVSRYTGMPATYGLRLSWRY